MNVTTYSVTGMTCGHCVSSVAEEIGKIAGVNDVAINLVTGGESQVKVTSDVEVPAAEVRAAVGEAGYTLVSTPA